MDDGAVKLSGLDRETLAKIGPAMQAIVDQGLLSGVVTLVWRNGEIAQVTTNGMRDIAAGKPMERDSLFRIMSMTKPVASVAALMLYEEGKFQLDEPITEWAPEFADMRVLKDAQGPVDETYPAPRDITFDDLFTHRSGLAYAFTGVGPIAHAYQKTLGDVLGGEATPDAWMQALATLPLLYAPGDRFQYGHSSDVLGFIVGRMAGKPFRDFLFERIFDPLGMVDTDFWIPPAKRDRTAQVYKLKGAHDLELVRFPDRESPPAFAGGSGGLVSTADDYLKFARTLLADGELDGVRLLKPETVALMRTNRLTPAQREIPFIGFPFWAGQGFGLGLSVIDNIEKQAWMGAGSNGAFSWPGAYGTWWRADPQENMILIYLIQNAMDLGPESASQLATGQRMAAQAALPTFQNLVYAAAGR